MSVTMKDVKAISIPQGTVRDIWKSGKRIWGSQADFPYRKLEYIHFSGAEYFDTGYQPTTTTEFKMNVKITAGGYNGKGYIGVRNRYAIGTTGGDNPTYFIGIGNWITTDIAVDSNFHIVSIKPNGFGASNQGFYYDGTRYDYSNISMINGGSGNVYIGASNTGSGAANYLTQDVKLVQLIENTTLVRDLIPVQRKSDNKCGFWDKVNSIFYPLSGTETTTNAAGPTIDEYFSPTLEAQYPYRKLKYIHFNGAEYIDFKNAMHTVATYLYNYEYTFSIDDNTITRQSFAGSYDATATSKSREWNIGDFQSSVGIKICVGNTWSNDNQYPLSTYLPNNTLRKIEVIPFTTSDSGMEWYLYDENNNQLGHQQITSSGKISPIYQYLMAIHIRSSSSDYPSNFTKGKIYQVKVGNIEGLKYRYWPCQRKSDGVCGIYETVHQVFYPMQGTTITNAAAGPIVNEYWNLQ